ncbi:unnamed protein product [Meloidogyne enterolobii]|uniref:Uncharacterized protein n=1 Tax=Meloidogyne enterolobii TaxID=390850 RepID=A0ACB1B057_MELEN
MNVQLIPEQSNVEYCLSGYGCIVKKIDARKWKFGCGICTGSEPCYQCNTNKCNKREAYLFCYERGENGKERIALTGCAKGNCYISVDITKAGGDMATALKKYTKQGCGDCPSTTIPCRTCDTKECNTEKFYKEKHYCWDTSGTVKECNSEHKRFCYYAVINDKKGIK